VVDGPELRERHGVRSFAAERFRSLLKMALVVATIGLWLPAELAALLYLLISPGWILIRRRPRGKVPKQMTRLEHLLWGTPVPADAIRQLLGFQFWRRKFVHFLADRLRMDLSEVRIALEHFLGRARAIENRQTRWVHQICHFYRALSPQEKRLLASGKPEDLFAIAASRKRQLDEVSEYSSYIKFVRRRRRDRYVDS